MFARVTHFEIDTVRMTLDAALERFKEMILPAVRRQPGYGGVHVMSTPEGKGLLISLWATEEAAEAGVTSGFYNEQVAMFLTFLREPPGRDHYRVYFSEAPVTA